VSQGITNWVWKHSRSENAARIVLLAIAHSADADGITEMSVLELAVKCRLGERTVQTAVRQLESLHELAVWPKAGAHRRNGYQVTTSKGAGSAPLTPAGYAPKHGRVQNLRGAESAGSKPDTSQVRTPKGADPAPYENDPLVVSTTGRSKAKVKNVSEVPARDDVQRLCVHLADRIEANGSKRPSITSRWQQAARLMLDKDGRTEQQVMTAIDWCQDHEFWRANILSMPKLREKYDQLRLQASRDQRPKPPAKSAILLRSMERAETREARNDANGNGQASGLRPRMLPAPGT
jgi:hypothetical protein